MLLAGLFAALGFIAGVDCQQRTTTIYKNLTPTATPAAGPVGYAGFDNSFKPPQAGPPGFNSFRQPPQVGPAGFDSVLQPQQAGQAGFNSFRQPPQGGPAGFDNVRQPPQAGTAITITNNPPSIVYQAVLSGAYGFQGYVTAQAGPGGVGVRFKMEARGLYGYGPFSYYIFERSVPQNGDCYALGGRLDPYRRGETPHCNLSAPETCQVGDLSGKYGRLDPVPNARKLFVDRFSSLKGSDASFIGGRSVAIVDNTGVRLACATFFEAEDLDYEDIE